MTDELIKTACPGPVTDAARAELAQALTRYTEAQQRVIVAYWDEVRWTRGTGRVRITVIIRELDYWSRYPADLIHRALEIHLRRYRDKPEEYTRGIIRNLARQSQLRPHSRERLREMRVPRREAHGYIDGSAGHVPF